MSITDTPGVSASGMNTVKNTAFITDTVEGVYQWYSASAPRKADCSRSAVALNRNKDHCRTDYNSRLRNFKSSRYRTAAMGISDAPAVSTAGRNIAENTAFITDSVKSVCQRCSTAAAGDSYSGCSTVTQYFRAHGS